MRALESLHVLTERRHLTMMEILILLRKLERKGFEIIFSWVPGHVGILGNEQADTAARSMSDHMQRSVCYQDLKTSIQHYVHHTRCTQLNDPTSKLSTDETIVQKVVKCCVRHKEGMGICLSE
ncbi:hypothetical protein TNCV_2562981 [Trichonephila clavipes]|uniref:RNase H type-1 domain-containing protein n=1 Tax=Trichonephila clavipes TaxID=2585209 RepID=A0A8X6R6M2_TRICX|nr:hypothetical protein TNCV_2562981 [Trichonephila clavipes]